MAKVDMVATWINYGGVRENDLGFNTLQGFVSFNKLELIGAFPSVGLKLTDRGLYEPNYHSDEEIKQTTSEIVEKTVYSDYQKMFDEFQNCRFDAITNKITK